jgi:CheY-like chemotaxis protein
MVTNRDYSILITDDDVSCRETLRAIIEPAGFRTVLAESGEQAIEIVRQESIHLVLLDMHMRQLTGLETIYFVHQINASLPCVLITADAEPSLLRKALNANVTSVIPKPVSKGLVLYTVGRIIGRFYQSADLNQPDQRTEL